MENQDNIIEIFRKLFDKLPVILLGTDNEGIIRFWNLGAEILTGYKKDEIENNENGLILIFSTENIMEILNENRKNKTPVKNLELKVTCKDGTIKTFAWYSTGFNLQTKDISNWAIGIDVSYKSKVQENLTTKINQIEEFITLIEEKESKIIELSKQRESKNTD